MLNAGSIIKCCEINEIINDVRVKVKSLLQA